MEIIDLNKNLETENPKDSNIKVIKINTDSSTDTLPSKKKKGFGLKM